MNVRNIKMSTASWLLKNNDGSPKLGVALDSDGEILITGSDGQEIIVYPEDRANVYWLVTVLLQAVEVGEPVPEPAKPKDTKLPGEGVGRKLFSVPNAVTGAQPAVNTGFVSGVTVSSADARLINPAYNGTVLSEPNLNS